MLRALFGIFACVIAAGCWNGEIPARAGEAQAPGNGDAVRDPNEIDLGSISSRKPVSHVFILKNTTERPVNITGKTDSCGCISSAIDRETIPPGEQARVTVTFDPAGYEGMAVWQFVCVTTDDPEHQFYRFSIRAQVR